MDISKDKKNKNKKIILITGASGFIGNALVNYLLSKGFFVRALVRKNRLQEQKNLEILEGDLKNYNSLLESTKNVDIVVHLAAMKSDEKDSYEVNVNGAKNLVQACKDNKVKLIINISTASTKIKVKGTYAKTKALADEIIMKSSISAITLRPSVVYGDLKNGVFGSLVKYASLPLTPIFGDGKCSFRPIYLEDLLKTIEIAIKNKKLYGKTYDIGGPDQVSLNLLIKEIAKNLNSKDKVRIAHIPKSVGFAIAKLLSLLLKKSPITESNILGSTQDVNLDVAKCYSDFNFKPLSLREGINLIKKKEEFKEAEVVLSYIFPKYKKFSKFDKYLEEVYFKALSSNNIENKISILLIRKNNLIGPLDAISKALYPNCTLQKRLKIASAVIECSPYSAQWLLPRDRKVTEIFSQSTIIISKSIIKIILGALLLLIPGFVRKNVK
ncbi:MAG: NAD-dependent epimerase/dehydratase family protein [Nanoarchaeota archaeon]